VSFRAQRIGIGTVFAVHGAVTGTFATRIPAIAENLHLAPGALGAALFMPAVGSLALMPFTGRLIHRLGGKAATHILLGLWCVLLILPSLATSLITLCLALLFYGAASGTADVAMNAQGVALEQRVGKSIISGLHGLWSVGGFIAAGIGALAAHENVDVRIHFGVMAIALLILGQVACHWLAPTDRADPTVDAVKPPRFALPSGIVLVIGLVAFCAVFAELAGTDWVAVYLRRVLGAGHTTAAFGYTVFAAGMAICRLTGDRFIRRLGAQRSVRIGGTVGTAGAVLIVLAVNSALTIIGFGLMGIGIAVVVPLAFAAAGRVGAGEGGEGGSQTGHAIAGVATIAYGSGLAAPGAIGGLASITSLRVSFILVAVLVAVIAVGAGVLRESGPSGDGSAPIGRDDDDLDCAPSPSPAVP
jgi:MFS family permease